MSDRALSSISGDDLHLLDELLEANGLDRGQVANSADSVTHLEMFLHQYPRMVGIQLFPNLKSLSLINQVGPGMAWHGMMAPQTPHGGHGVHDLRGILITVGHRTYRRTNCRYTNSHAPGLTSPYHVHESMWPLPLSYTPTFAMCMRACAPYHSPTHAQDIHEIENLSFCPALEKLFLVENLIRKLKGLDRLVNLKELHLHSNRIARIEGLKKLQKLEVRTWGPDWWGTMGED